jgi:hypothetical protein
VRRAGIRFGTVRRMFAVVTEPPPCTRGGHDGPAAFPPNSE